VIQDQDWRGIGEIPASGLSLAPDYADFDASIRFPLGTLAAPSPGPCVAGEILRGVMRPPDCPEFGKSCTSEHPLGATMVSSEGACAAYYRYRRALP
jgi:hydrogenase expression/formation protein HypD